MMATKRDFSVEEWHTLRNAPHLVVMAVASAGASGLFGSLKEAIAPAGAIIEALKGDNALLKDICHKDEIRAAVDEIKEETRSTDFDSLRATLRDAAIRHARSALTILKEKGRPEDVKAYGDFLMTLADRVANAAKEGSFLGFGGERFSEPERALLAELGQVLGRQTGVLEA
jgi:hypothetical protein